VKLKEILECINGRILCAQERVEELDFERAAASDLMSEVLILARENMLLITGLTTPQVVRTADVIGIPAVVIVRKDSVPPETIEAAKASRIVLAVTKMTMFEVCGKLYCEKKIKPIW